MPPSLIIPKGVNVRQAQRSQLAEFLRSRDGQEFANTVSLTDVLSKAVANWAATHKFGEPIVVKALLGSMVSYVQSAIDEQYWDHIGAVLAEEIRGRLTVRQVNDDYR